MDEGDENRLLSGGSQNRAITGKYSEARDGDDLMISFECDFCVFQKIVGRMPDQGVQNDRHLMGCIRRVILDAFGVVHAKL